MDCQAKVAILALRQHEQIGYTARQESAVQMSLLSPWAEQFIELRARQLRAEGLDGEKIGRELAWENEVRTAYRRYSNDGPASDDHNETKDRLNAETVRTLIGERDELQDRLDHAEAQLEKLRNELQDHKLSGKSRQTFLKIIYLFARGRDFDPNHRNGVVSGVLGELADFGISAEDDEAIRNLFKAAFDRKLGGYWEPKTRT